MRASLGGQSAVSEVRELHLHIHHIRVSLYQTVAYLQRGLEADLRLLHGEHGLLKAHGRIFQLHFALQLAGVVLRRADRLQRALKGLAKSASHGRSAGTADFGELGAQLGGGEGRDLQVHINIQQA